MADKNDHKIRVWDLPVRLFHWTLVVLMAVSYFTGRAGDVVAAGGGGHRLFHRESRRLTPGLAAR